MRSATLDNKTPLLGVIGLRVRPRGTHGSSQILIFSPSPTLQKIKPLEDASPRIGYSLLRLCSQEISISIIFCLHMQEYWTKSKPLGNKTSLNWHYLPEGSLSIPWCGDLFVFMWFPTLLPTGLRQAMIVSWNKVMAVLCQPSSSVRCNLKNARQPCLIDLFNPTVGVPCWKLKQVMATICEPTSIGVWTC